MVEQHDAFISYSHGVDGVLAADFERGLERLAKPTFRLRAMDVFRDKSSLAAAPGLWSGIESHLSASRWFLLMASPGSAASPWCNKEIEWWLDNREASAILFILTDGEIEWDAAAGDFDWTRTTAIPEIFRGRFKEEPLYVDLRWARDKPTAAVSDRRFREAVLDVAAPIRDVPKDQLDGDDVRQLRRTRLLARAGVMTITVVAAVAVWQAVEATRQRHVAEMQRDTALSRQLASVASEVRVQQPRLSLQLAAQAIASRPTAEAATSLLRVLHAAPFERMIDLPQSLWTLAVSSDEQWVVVGDGDHGTQLIHVTSGEATRLVPEDDRVRSVGSKGTLAVAVSPDATSIASGGFDQAITLWTDGKEVLQIADTHEGFVMDLAFGPDGSTLASAGSDGRVFVHDLASQTSRRLKDGWKPEVSAVSFSPDGVLLAAGGDDAFVAIYRLASGDASSSPMKTNGVIGGRSATTSVVDIQFSSNGTELFVGYLEGIVEVYDANSRTLSARFETNEYGSLNAIAVDRDGLTVFTGHSDGAVVRWRRPQGTYESWDGDDLYRHSGKVHGLAFLPVARQLVSAGFDGRVYFSIPSFSPPLVHQRSDAGHSDPAETAPPALTPPDRKIASHSDGAASTDEAGTLIVEVRGRRIEMPGAASSSILVARFSPDARALYTLHADGRLRGWSTERVAPPFGETQITDPFLPQLVVSGDGKLLAVAPGEPPDFGASGRRAKSNRVFVFRANDLAPLAMNLESIPGSGSISIDGLFFTPDAKKLVMKSSASGDRLTIWDLATFQRLEHAIVIPAFSRMVGFAGESNRALFVTTEGGSSAVFEISLSPEEWASQACRLAGMAITRDEWARYVGRELDYSPACVEGRFLKIERP
jgi:WD40 repeat protein